MGKETATLINKEIILQRTKQIEDMIVDLLDMQKKLDIGIKCLQGSRIEVRYAINTIYYENMVLTINKMEKCIQRINIAILTQKKSIQTMIELAAIAV